MVNSYVYYKEKLQGEYKDTFNKIEMYVNANHLDEQSKEELMSNLLDTFLSAQENQRPVEKITGKNIERFCKTFCSGYGLKEHILHFFESIAPCIWLLFVISSIEMIGLLLDLLNEEPVDFFNYRSSFGILSYGVGLMLAYLIETLSNFIIKRIMFKRKKITMAVTFSLRIAIFAVVIVALIAFFGGTEEPDTPLWLIYSVAAVSMIFYLIITSKKRKARRENKISFWELADSASGENSMAEYEKRLYFKRNQKREKKGLSPLTQEEFLSAEEAECYKVDKRPVFYISLPFIITALCTLLVSVMSGFDTPTDVWFFVILIFAVECALMFGMWRIVKKGNAERLEWINSEREHPTVWENVTTSKKM